MSSHHHHHARRVVRFPLDHLLEDEVLKKRKHGERTPQYVQYVSDTNNAYTTFTPPQNRTAPATLKRGRLDWRQQRRRRIGFMARSLTPPLPPRELDLHAFWPRVSLDIEHTVISSHGCRAHASVVKATFTPLANVHKCARSRYLSSRGAACNRCWAGGLLIGQ